MAKAKKLVFPQRIYVQHHIDRNDPNCHFLVAQDDKEEASDANLELGQTEPGYRVGVYQFVETIRLVRSVVVQEQILGKKG